jgi:hypothetical protein
MYPVPGHISPWSARDGVKLSIRQAGHVDPTSIGVTLGTARWDLGQAHFTETAPQKLIQGQIGVCCDSSRKAHRRGNRPSMALLTVASS